MEGIQFNVGPFPVVIRPFFLLLAGLMSVPLGWPYGLLFALVLFTSLLIHELGHALAFRRYGIPSAIELHGLGGTTYPLSGGAVLPLQSMLISLAGPGLEILAGLAALVLAWFLNLGGPLGFLLDVFGRVSIFWGVFNLLPVLPWDGGQALDALATFLTRKHPVRWVGLVSMVVGLGVVAAGLSARGMSIFLVYFGGMGIWLGYQRWSLTAGVQVVRPPRPEGPPPSLQEAQDAFNRGDLHQAQVLVHNALDRIEDPLKKDPYQQLLAWIALAQADVEQAQRALDRMLGPADPELLARVALAGGQPEKAVAALIPLADRDALRLPAWSVLVSALLALSRPAEVVQRLATLLERSGAGAARAVQNAADKLLAAGAWSEATELGSRLFAAQSTPQAAVTVAAALSSQGQAEEAVSWLRKAVGAGLAEVALLTGQSAFEPLKGSPDFQEILAGVKARTR